MYAIAANAVVVGFLFSPSAKIDADAVSNDIDPLDQQGFNDMIGEIGYDVDNMSKVSEDNADPQWAIDGMSLPALFPALAWGGVTPKGTYLELGGVFGDELCTMGDLLNGVGFGKSVMAYVQAFQKEYGCKLESIQTK